MANVKKGTRSLSAPAKGKEVGFEVPVKEAKPKEIKLKRVWTQGLSYVFCDAEELPYIIYREGSVYKILKDKDDGVNTKFEEIEDIDTMVDVQNGMDKWYGQREKLEQKKQMALKGPEEYEKGERLKTLKGLLREKQILKEKIKAMQLQEGIDESSSASSSRTATMKTEDLEEASKEEKNEAKGS